MVDNGSQDDSIRYVKDNFPWVNVIQNNRNLGFAKGNNIGAKKASGEYIAFLNNDTRVDPNWLKELIATISEKEGVICVGGRILSWNGRKIDFVGGSLNFYGMGFHPHYGELNSDCITETKEILFACGGSMLINKEVFLECGGFDEDYFAYFEDVDLGWRLWVLGYKVMFTPRAITYHRYQATSKKFPTYKRVVLYERNALYTIIKNYNDENLYKILPIAILLTIKRGLMLSTFDKHSFSIEKSSPSGPHLKLLTKSFFIRVERAIKYYGLLRAFVEIGRRMLKSIGAKVTPFDEGLIPLPKESLSPLVALDDLIESLPDLMKKRKWIQSKRKRSDSEILSLFITPFHPNPPFPEYVKIQQSLAHCFNINKIFEGKN